MFHTKVREEPACWLLLKLLLVADLAFVILCIFQGFGLLNDEELLISHDRSYGEVFQYIKQLWIATILASLAVSRRCIFSAVFSSLFFYFMADDYLQLHEQLGEWIVGSDPERMFLGVQAYHFGEVTVFALYGFVILTAILLTFPREPKQRKLARDVILLIAVLAFFAVVVDVFHSIAPSGILEDGLALLEEGGEMFAMSLIVWRVFLEQATAGQE